MIAYFYHRSRRIKVRRDEKLFLFTAKQFWPFEDARIIAFSAQFSPHEASFSDLSSVENGFEKLRLWVTNARPDVRKVKAEKT